MAGFTLETDPQIVLQAFRPLLLPIYEAFEVAIPRALQIVSENGWDPSGHLVSHLTRAEAKRLLDGKDCPVELDDTPRALSMDRVAMEGLATTFNEIAIKIRKGSEIPKASTKRQEAFYQQSVPGLWLGGAMPPLTKLLVLWDCTSSGSKLSLRLCCTKDKLAEDYWMVGVPHPAEWMGVLESISVDDDFNDLLGGENEKRESR